MQVPHKKGPLNGVAVITLAHAIAAPFRTRQLADLGRTEADVQALRAED